MLLCHNRPQQKLILFSYFYFQVCLQQKHITDFFSFAYFEKNNLDAKRRKYDISEGPEVEMNSWLGNEIQPS